MIIEEITTRPEFECLSRVGTWYSFMRCVIRVNDDISEHYWTGK
jgi:hypothetical protein